MKVHKLLRIYLKIPPQHQNEIFCITKDQDLLDKFNESNLIRSLHCFACLRDRTDQLNTRISDSVVKDLFKEMNGTCRNYLG